MTLRKQRPDPDQLVDVEWARDVEGVFDAGIRLLVADRRGLLADLATAIADADGNIDNVSMERPDGGDVLAMFFSVQVKDRRHLAHVMRALKRVPDVRRIQRARGPEFARPCRAPASVGPCDLPGRFALRRRR